MSRLESSAPADTGVPGYQSAETHNFERAEIIALIEQTSVLSADSQIEFYRQRFGGIADAEMTLEIMEFTEYDPRWWRVALEPAGHSIGIVLPVLAFGEPTVGYIGVLPKCRGRRIASFLLTEAWATMKPAGYPTLYAEVDQENVSMRRALDRERVLGAMSKAGVAIGVVSGERLKAPYSPAREGFCAFGRG